MRKNWSEAECYFAVWAYDRLDIDRDQTKIELYRQVAEITGRNEKAVENKIQNVAFFDRRPREERVIAERSNAQTLLGEVFKWYWADREGARSLFPGYFQQVQFGVAGRDDAEPVPTKGSLPNLLIEEGAAGLYASSRRGRSRKLLEMGRRYFRTRDPKGKLRCRVCDFSTPGTGNSEVVQLHHTEPLYSVGEQGRTLPLHEAITTLVPLCPTCHAIAHTERPPLDVASIRRLRDI